MFKFSENLVYAIPAHFGGDEGPFVATIPDATKIVISYETDREALEQYIPEEFEVTRPLINILYSQNRRCSWLAGGSYNMVGVSVPVVFRVGDEPAEGEYVLVIWENKTEAILSGREQSGMPKLFADIQDLHQIDDHFFTHLSFEGSSFLNIDFERKGEDSTRKNTTESVNQFGWRYVPNVGKPGATLSCPTVFPHDFNIQSAWHGEGRLQWQTLAYEKHPLQARIIYALSLLPIKCYVGTVMQQVQISLRNDLSRQLPTKN